MYLSPFLPFFLNRPVDLSFDLALLDIFAFIVYFFALPYGDLHLGPATLVKIYLGRYKRLPFAAQTPIDALKFRGMDQKLARPVRRLIHIRGLFIRDDIQIVKIKLTLVDMGKGICKTSSAGSKAFDLAPVQGNAALPFIKKMIIVVRFFIGCNGRHLAFQTVYQGIEPGFVKINTDLLRMEF